MSRQGLDPSLVHALQRVARGRMLAAFDLDGTLSPLVKHHARARVPASTLSLLREVVRRYPTVVITGRARRDALARLTGVPLHDVIGNHGLEGPKARRDASAAVRAWRRQLPAFLPPWALVEDKHMSVSLHIRNASTRPMRALTARLAKLQPAPRIVPGKSLLNLLPDLGLHKGTALLAAMRAHRVSAAVFVGDDRTDEDAFLLPRRAVISVRVGRQRASAARYSIRRQSDIDQLLAVLVAARAVTRRRRPS